MDASGSAAGSTSEGNGGEALSKKLSNKKKRTRSEADEEEDGKPSAAPNTVSDSTMDAGLNEKKWEEMFGRLEEFKESHGHCRVPNRHPEDPQLGNWVSSQRRQYKAMQEKGSGETWLNESRVKRLESLGFQWSTKDPKHVPWKQRYEELVAFKDKYGHAQVPIGWEENVQLSNWVSTQRQEYKLLLKGRSSRLTRERIDLLNTVKFVWEAQRGGPRRKRKATVAVPPKAFPVNIQAPPPPPLESENSNQLPTYQITAQEDGNRVGSNQQFGHLLNHTQPALNIHGLPPGFLSQSSLLPPYHSAFPPSSLQPALLQQLQLQLQSRGDQFQFQPNHWGAQSLHQLPHGFGAAPINALTQLQLQQLYGQVLSGSNLGHLSVPGQGLGAPSIQENQMAAALAQRGVFWNQGIQPPQNPDPNNPDETESSS